MTQPLPAGPEYGSRNLADLMPSAAAAMGVTGLPNTLGLPSSSKYCIIMVDGLGHRLVKKHRGYLPFISKAEQRHIVAAYPTTTACSLTTLGTGVPPGTHGVLGYDVYDPDRDTVNNMLSGWDPTLDIASWQPAPTVFEQLLPTHVSPVTVSMPRFADSGLTRASLHSSDYRGANTMPARVRAAIEALNEPGNQLVYLYFDETDVAGHRYGVDSTQWREAAEEIDLWVRKFITGLNKTKAGAKTTVYLTADHGMLDVPESGRIDLAEESWLTDQLHTTAGDPRFLQLFLKPDVDPAALHAKLADRWGKHAWVVTKEQMLSEGWFGEVPPKHQARLGELLIAAREPIAFFDTPRVGERALGMVGQHGSLTPVEREVPLYRLN
ncbi:alkaline phosphatase family protein [Micrococcoides hystricis]|uniref:Alkaline phosphatase family protein n=1 Tax=Micrococcoides hystricis TaxID=1572761 RepID=A0ABV6P6W9_9MICC